MQRVEDSILGQGLAVQRLGGRKGIGAQLVEQFAGCLSISTGLSSDYTNKRP